MISLSDGELQIVMAAARPIPARDRDSFLRDCAAELGKHELIGPAVIGRVVADLQRKYLNAPGLPGGKYR